MAANHHNVLGFNRGRSSNFWWLRNANYRKIICDACRKEKVQGRVVSKESHADSLLGYEKSHHKRFP